MIRKIVGILASIAVLLAMSLFISCSPANDGIGGDWNPDGIGISSGAGDGTGFCIYLDSGELVISHDHIEEYFLDTHVIELNEAGVEQWNSFKLNNEEFIVRVNGKEIYRGKFFLPISSSISPGVYIIYVPLSLDDEHNRIAIRFDEHNSIGEDPRNAPEVIALFS